MIVIGILLFCYFLKTKLRKSHKINSEQRTIATESNFNPEKNMYSTYTTLRILNNHQQGCSSCFLIRLQTSLFANLTIGHQPLADSVIESMEQSERKTMRLASHLHPWTSNVKLYNHFFVPTLRDHINKLNHNYITRLLNSEILYFHPHLRLC